MPADGQVARGMRSSPIGSTSRVPYGEGSWPRPPILSFIETIVRMRQFANLGAGRSGWSWSLSGAAAARVWCR